MAPGRWLQGRHQALVRSSHGNSLPRVSMLSWRQGARPFDELGGQLRQRFGVETRSVVTDLSQEGAVDDLGRAVVDLELGLVISNAGTGQPGRFLEEDHSKQLERFRLNALAHLNIAYLFGDRLARRGRGGLVLGGAMGAAQGIPFMATDAAAKALVQSLGESLHVELQRRDVHVMTLGVPP